MSSLGEATSSRWVTLTARWVKLRARWVPLRARWVTLRASWVTLRACWVTLSASWVTLGARALGGWHASSAFGDLFSATARPLVARENRNALRNEDLGSRRACKEAEAVFVQLRLKDMVVRTTRGPIESERTEPVLLG
jgi:hypothetical protein